MHDPPPPCAVNTIKAVRLEHGQCPADGSRPLRDEVRIAAHEAQVTAVGPHGHDVAGKQRSRPVLAAGPVQHLPSVECTPALMSVRPSPISRVSPCQYTMA